MLDSIFASSGSVDLKSIFISTGTCLILGVIIALVCRYRNNFSKSFTITLTLLPALVQAVIMVVNGNLGAGVAVAGAFSLVRFRSAPGTSNEIACVFFATVVGITAGMGYLVYSIFLVVAIGITMLLLNFIKFGSPNARAKKLRIMIPEDLDYHETFDDILKEYCTSYDLQRVRTTNLGGLYELQYSINLKDVKYEKTMLDSIRQRNGNLTVISGIQTTTKDEL